MGMAQSVTPLRWRNTQLASPDWLPISVEIQNWPGIDTPLYVEFRGVTDWAIPTDFTLDNIPLATACQ